MQLKHIYLEMLEQLQRQKSVDLYAKYSAEYHVYYLDANGNTIYTQKYAENDKLDYSDVKLSVGANQSCYRLVY